MSPGTKFFICSSAILALSIVNLTLSPSYNAKISTWNLYNCKKVSDELDEEKSKEIISQENISDKEAELRQCKYKKSLYYLEQGDFIINVGIGFLCVLFGLFSLEKELKSKVGMLGLLLGIIGLIVTLGYTILNIIIYTRYYDSPIYKIEEDGSYAISNGDHSYKCIFFNKEYDKEALIAKFSDLMKSQYNYNKELKDSFDSIEHPEKYECNKLPGLQPSDCSKDGILKDYRDKQCEKLYYFVDYSNYANYDKSVRFLTCLILSIFTLICHVGLFISGIMLFKESSS